VTGGVGWCTHTAGSAQIQAASSAAPGPKKRQCCGAAGGAVGQHRSDSRRNKQLCAAPRPMKHDNPYNSTACDSASTARQRIPRGTRDATGQAKRLFPQCEERHRAQACTYSTGARHTAGSTKPSTHSYEAGHELTSSQCLLTRLARLSLSREQALTHGKLQASNSRVAGRSIQPPLDTQRVHNAKNCSVVAVTPRWTKT
jgi:hypothetical protein